MVYPYGKAGGDVMSGSVKLSAITLDCPDPLVLADFYQRVTGWARHAASGPDFAALHGPGGLVLGFQRVADYRAPTWPSPEVPQQAHLDFTVDDVDAAEAELLALGAVSCAVQPGERYRVLLDPAGHPFCVTAG